MTREEAINKWIIPAIKNTWNEKKCNEILKALEQEPFMNIPCVSHQVCHEDKVKILDKIRAEIDSYCSNNRDRNDGLYIAMRIIDRYKAEGSEE